MTLSPDQIRTALADLNGQRDVHVEFDHGPGVNVRQALLVPVEQDNIVKLTDGTREYLLDASRISWVQIG